MQYRDDIYSYFQTNTACQKYFYSAEKKEQFVAYYNSMYLLQDTTETLWHHRQRGFSSDPFLAYLEFWGLTQAVIVQQDSIAEIYEVMLGKPMNPKVQKLTAWLGFRDVRNVCAGHPAKKNRPRNAPVVRSFMGRAFGGYGEITYERWEQGVGITHPRVPLGALLDAYAGEAEKLLSIVLTSMKDRWP